MCRLDEHDVEKQLLLLLSWGSTHECFCSTLRSSHSQQVDFIQYATKFIAYLAFHLLNLIFLPRKLKELNNSQFLPLSWRSCGISVAASSADDAHARFHLSLTVRGLIIILNYLPLLMWRPSICVQVMLFLSLCTMPLSTRVASRIGIQHTEHLVVGPAFSVPMNLTCWSCEHPSILPCTAVSIRTSLFPELWSSCKICLC